MVNYHDPAVVLQDTRTYAFAAKYMGSGSQLTSFDSGSDENLACCGWTLLVCLPRRALGSHNNSIIIIRCLSLAGSSLPLSITSGVSSEGIAPSVGQYGFVLMHCICWVSLPRSGRRTSLSHLADLLHHAHIHSYRCNTYPGGC
jgi:hypothetical protein